MKKIALVSLAAALVLPVAALAQTTSTTTTTMAAPAAAMTASKKVELKDGSWAQVEADGDVKVSKDGGKTWTVAPDGTWQAKDGSKITTKAGKVAQ
jgi:type II secretory pathway pseudopilin PulG